MCVNKLLQEGTISYVFFASDSLLLRYQAEKLIMKNASHLLFEVEGVYHGSNSLRENLEIRNKKSMHLAMAEWYLIGEADYCMSPSIEHSTYSKTAIARGNCQYLSYHDKDKCDIKKDKSNDKEIFLKTREKDHLYFKVPIKDSDSVWESIKKYPSYSMGQCLSEEDQSKKIFNYWKLHGDKAFHKNYD